MTKLPSEVNLWIFTLPTVVIVPPVATMNDGVTEVLDHTLNGLFAPERGNTRHSASSSFLMSLGQMIRNPTRMLWNSR